MASEYLRDSAMSALILGFFASSWFGWAQERPPVEWRAPLIVGAIASLLVAASGGVLAWQHWSDSSALDEPGAMTRFGIIVGIEFTVSAVGAGILTLSGHSSYMACWICFVVGVHFWPLAPVLNDRSLYPLGLVLIVIAIAATMVAARDTSLAPSAITGAGAGATLLVFASGAAFKAITS